MNPAWLAAAEAALDAAGAAIRPYFRAGVAIEDKPDESPVTTADRAAERAIRDVLIQHTPEHGLLGEEYPDQNTDRRYVWVIDPIDGTRAFITGRPSFCTLLALLENGVPILGFIDQPVTRERWSGGNDMPLRFTGPLGGAPGTRATARLGDAELSSTAPEALGEDLPRFDRLKARCRRIYWGGDAYAYGLLALGQIDLVAETNLKPWDWAALAPIVRSAGGIVTTWSGGQLRLGCDGTALAAANATLHEAALKAL